jgi:four helix bundle protein
MDRPTEIWFDHEKLDVYQDAIALVGWLADQLDGTSRLGEMKDQLDRASSSIVLNIAEGNGKYSRPDRCRYFNSAHGSSLECAAGLDVLVARKRVRPEQIRTGKERLQRMVRMLVGLIKRNSDRKYGRQPADE